MLLKTVELRTAARYGCQSSEETNSTKPELWLMTNNMDGFSSPEPNSRIAVKAPKQKWLLILGWRGWDSVAFHMSGGFSLWEYVMRLRDWLCAASLFQSQLTIGEAVRSRGSAKGQDVRMLDEAQRLAASLLMFPSLADQCSEKYRVQMAKMWENYEAQKLVVCHFLFPANELTNRETVRSRDSVKGQDKRIRLRDQLSTTSFSSSNHPA